MVRTTFSLPNDLVSELDKISTMLGCSRSALVSLMLSEQVPILEPLATSLYGIPSTDESVRRARGYSLKVIKERYREALDGFEMYQAD